MVTSRVFGKNFYANRSNHLEDMAVERLNNGYLGTSQVTGCNDVITVA